MRLRLSLTFASALLAANLLPSPPGLRAETLPAIAVETVALRPMADRVIATGFIAPIEEIQVQPLIEGQPIEALLADVGDMVEAGQILARLSPSTLELQLSQSTAALASARATVAQAEAQLVEAEASAADAERSAERTRKLKDQGSATQAAADTAGATAVAATARVSVARQSLEAARAQVALYHAQLENVQLQLTRTEVKAPYAGRIVARNATVGAIATAAGLPMFVLERDGALELRADVSEGDLLRLSPGQPAEATAVGLEAPLAGQVRLIEPAIDPTTRLGRVRISLPGEAPLRAGMYMESVITLRQAEVPAVPLTAVGRGAENQSEVLLLNDKDTLVAVAVTLGMRDGGWVEVTSGLAPGDRVVAKAGAFVRAGDRIRPVDAEAAN